MILTHQFVSLTSARIHYVTAGKSLTDKPVLVFLHGFPEYWQSWQHQLQYFSQTYQVVALDLPGYNLSEKFTSTEAYKIPNLIEILRQFIVYVSRGKPVVLVAHDWGGALAWPLCAFHQSLFQGLVILNAAHPSTFTREMIHNPEQRTRSHYIHTLISQEATDTLRQDNFAYLRRILFDQRLDGGFSDVQQQAYLKTWQQSGAVDGMLNYYRAMPQIAGAENSVNARQVSDVSAMTIPKIRVNIPTLVLWGEKDEAFALEVLQGLETYVEKVNIVRFDDASHWLQHEKPKQVNAHIKAFIEGVCG